ncbi:hypothetical protein [Streptomyces sp. 1331.2]|uniref:hypothetical protein n=1 Tax=Streptomyces sp. 1331.2 TaxID=1938835 RepID=UPI000BCBD84E|nr:hypothetical protein [Streptomyces sp. 1331.2]SOB86245.1 hypothetical protein SAMN06272789_6555 [Streptomyces sp. 1331.2]
MASSATPGTSGPGPDPSPRQRRGRGKKDDLPWPRRPLLTALWIPAATLLLPVGGALGAFGPWLLLPSLALVLTGFVGLVYAVFSLCQVGPLRLAALALLLAPAIGVPLLSMSTAQATVLGLHGVAHPGTVTGVRVSHGKTTTYSCAVRYADVPGRGSSVRCGAWDAVGEQVSVTEDPDGLVDPEFTSAATGGRFDLSLVGLSDAALLVVAGSAAGLGAAVHLLRARRACSLQPPQPPFPPQPQPQPQPQPPKPFAG